MKFIDLPIATENGITDIPINPEHVIMLIKIPIPTGLTAADGKTPMVKSGTGLVLSNGNVLPCRLVEDQVKDLLNGKSNISH